MSNEILDVPDLVPLQRQKGSLGDIPAVGDHAAEQGRAAQGHCIGHHRPHAKPEEIHLACVDGVAVDNVIQERRQSLTAFAEHRLVLVPRLIDVVPRKAAVRKRKGSAGAHDEEARVVEACYIDQILFVRPAAVKHDQEWILAAPGLLRHQDAMFKCGLHECHLC